MGNNTWGTTAIKPLLLENQELIIGCKENVYNSYSSLPDTNRKKFHL